MKPKNLVTIVLLLFVVASVGYLVMRESGATAPATPPAESAAAVTPDATLTPAIEPAASRVVAYYFHGNARCTTCKTIEKYTEEAIEDGLVEEVASGKLELVAVNVDMPENRHFIDDFELATRTVVLARIENGEQAEYQKLDEVWNLVRNRGAFLDYVKGETRKMLQELG